MQQLELRPRQVTYCDVCGHEITGNHTIVQTQSGAEFHGCDRWSEELESRCSARMARLLSGEATPTQPVAPGLQVMPADLAQRCVELSQWQLTGKLKGTALSAFATEHWPGNSYALQLAEAATVREALQYLAQLQGVVSLLESPVVAVSASSATPA